MWDPYVTRELTIRDLLVHRSGLGPGRRRPALVAGLHLDRKEIARRLRYIRPATSFRSAYAYDNVLYLVAGEVIEAVSGQSWEDFVHRPHPREGRDDDGSNVAAFGGGQQATSPRRMRPSTARYGRSPFDSDNTNPAGGINSNADDMARWMIVQLARGKLADGSRLFSDSTWQQLTTLVTPMPIDSVPPEFRRPSRTFTATRSASIVQDYRGRKVLTHTGGLPGLRLAGGHDSRVDLGVAVLTNQESGAAFDAIAYHIVDHYLARQRSTGCVPTRRSRPVRSRRRAASRGGPRTNTPPRVRRCRSRRYAGTYTDDWYGDIAIERAGGRLAIRFTHTPALVGDLEHWQYDTFVAKWRDRELRADAFITFALNPDGTIEQAKMVPTSPTVDFSYDFQDLLLKPKKTP